MKKIYLLPVFAITLLLISCGGETEKVTKEPTKKIEAIVEEVEEIIEEEEEEEVVDLTNTGIGPITELKFGTDIDEAMAKKGEDLYASKGCTACHNPTMKIVGPAPQGIFERRNPAWVMNMILNPTEMLANDEDAKALLVEYNNIPMNKIDITKEETRSILEYFRTI
jgi:cytochrome c